MELDKKNNNTGFIVIIIILIMLVLGLGFYICYDKGFIFNMNKSASNKVTEKRDNKEIKITDNYIKRDLTKKVNVILSLGIGTLDNNISKIDYTNVYSLSASNYENYSDDDKLFTTLNLNRNNFRTMSLDDFNKIESRLHNFMNESFGNESLDVFSIYETESITKTYKEIFGTTPTHKDIEKNCPYYWYDSTNQKYYMSSECSWSDSTNVIGYIYDYTKKNNEAYTYFSIGTIYNSAKDVCIDFYTVNDTDTTTIKYDKDLPEDGINESNYKDFAKYKMTFKRNAEGIYYFVKFEEIN